MCDSHAATRVSGVRSLLAETSAAGGAASRDGHKRLAVFIGDATLDGDRASLVALHRGLQRLYARHHGREDSAEARGRLRILLDTVNSALARLGTAAGELDADELRALSHLARQPAAESGAIARALDMEAAEARAITLALRRRGLVRDLYLGAERCWEVTPRGRAALSAR